MMFFIITTQKSSGTRYVLKPDVTDEILMNKENYDTVFHRHTHKCVQTVDSDGQCKWLSLKLSEIEVH